MQERRIREALTEQQLRDIRMFTDELIRKLGKYVRAVIVFGSQVTGKGKTSTSDLDVAVIIDDTDVEEDKGRMTRDEIKRILMGIVTTHALLKESKIHPQVYLLTEWVKYIMERSPVILTILKNGYAFFDTGVFLPYKIMLNKGEIELTKEATDRLISQSDRLIEEVERIIGRTKNDIIWSTFWAAVTASQALLNELGVFYPTPKEVPEVLRKEVVEKRKLLTEEDVKSIEDAIKLWKDVEHGRRNIKDIPMREIWDVFERVRKVVKKIENAISQIRGEPIKKEEKEAGQDVIKKIIEEELGGRL